MLRNVGFPSPASLDQTLYWALFFVDVLDDNPAPVPTYTITGLRFSNLVASPTLPPDPSLPTQQARLPDPDAAPVRRGVFYSRR
jgi:hypothetical protein